MIRLMCGLALAALAACQPWPGQVRMGKPVSFVVKEYPLGAEGRLAADLTQALAEIYAPGHTVLYLQPVGREFEALGLAFDEALRARGFTLLPEPAPEAPTVTFVLDRLDEETWYTRLAVSEGWIVSRAYRWDGSGLTALEAARTRGGEDGGHRD